MSLKYELSDTTIYEPYTSPPRRWDTEPYGEDPVLASTSSIYFGKLEPERFYHASERINKTIIISETETETTLSTPRGFWPHSYSPRAPYIICIHTYIHLYIYLYIYTYIYIYIYI